MRNSILMTALGTAVLLALPAQAQDRTQKSFDNCGYNAKTKTDKDKCLVDYHKEATQGTRSVAPPPSMNVLGVKGDTIGESLADFRVKNKATFKEAEWFMMGSFESLHLENRTYPRCSGDNKPPFDKPQMPSPSLMASDYKTWQLQEAQYNKAEAEYDIAYDSTQQYLDDMEESYGEKLGADTYCTTAPNIVGNTLAGTATLQPISYLFKDQRLIRVEASFNTNDYEQVREAIINRYGEPTSTHVESYENKMGAVFRGEVAFWHKSTSSLLLSQISRDHVDESTILLDDDTLTATRDAARQQKANSDF